MSVRRDQVQLEITFITDESRALAKAIVDTDRLKANIVKLEGDIKDYEKELKKANTSEERRAELLGKVKEAQEKVGKNLKDISESGRDIQKLDLNRVAPAQLVTRAKQLADAMRLIPQSAPEYKAMETELKQVNDQMATLRLNTRGVAEEAQLSLGQKLVGGIKQYAAVLYASIIALAGKVIAEIATIVRETNELRREMNAITGATGKALDEQVVKTKALSTTFQLENREVMLAANTLSKEFNISVSQALDQIKRGLVNGANVSGQFLDNIREYSTQFRAAGASAGDFIDLSIKAEKEGIFSDKGQDLVKEFGLRIREQTKATKDAMTAAFGPKFSQQIFKGINDGSLTTVQALQRVATKMDDTKVPANELQTVIADVFGGPGEDAGLRFIQSLGEVQAGLEGVTEEALSFKKAQDELLEANTNLAIAQNDLAKNLFGLENGFNAVWTNLKTVGITAINDVIEYFQYLPATWAGITAAAKQLFTNLGNIFSGTVALNESVLDAYNKALLEASKPIDAQRKLALEEQQKQEEEALKTSETKRVEAEKQAAEAARKQREQQFNEKLKALDTNLDRERLLLENQRIKRQIEEKAYQEQLYQLEKVGLERKLALFRQYGQLRSIAALEATNQLAAIQQYETDRAKAAADAELQRLAQLGVQKLDIANIAAEGERKARQAVEDYTQKLADASIKDYRKRTEEQELAAAELAQRQQEIAAEMYESLGTATAEFFIGQKKSQKEYLKDILKTLLSAIQKQVLLGITGAVATEAASKPFPANLFTTATKVAAINVAFAAARVAVDSFAGGGQTRPLSGQRITGRPNIRPLPNGDNLLAYVRTGEVILNEPQQRLLGGPEVFRRIGVPGFADGGVAIPNTTPVAAPTYPDVQGAAALEEARLLREQVTAYMAKVDGWQRTMRVYLPYTDIEDKGKALNGLRVEASL